MSEEIVSPFAGIGPLKQYAPIAGISNDNHGPINTIASIVLIVTTLLISSVRYGIGCRRTLDFDIDDYVFSGALVFTIIASVVSQRMVSTGLGQRQDVLSTDQWNNFYKLQYTTHIFAVSSMAATKASVALMYRRLVPQSNQITRTLLPTVAAYALISLFLVAFQCQIPRPWVLQPEVCSTGGKVHYAAAGLNIFTDALLAVWLIPTFLKLQMDRRKKVVIVSLIVSRLVVCSADFGRIAAIRTALGSKDTTWYSLDWAVMDQVILHLSLNHATLPRIHVFLSGLQTGLLVPRLTLADNVDVSTSPGTKIRRTAQASQDDVQSCSRQLRSGFFSVFKPNTARHSVSLNDDAHGSKTQLRLQPEQGTEMSTFVTVGDGDSTSSAGNPKYDDNRRIDDAWRDHSVDGTYDTPPSLQNQPGIRMTHTVEVTTSYKD